MKKVILLFIMLFVFDITSGWAKGPIILKFNTHHPPVSHVVKRIFEPWIEKVNKAAEGEMEVRLYLGGALGKNPRQFLQMMDDGIFDISFIAASENRGALPDDLILQMPFELRDQYESLIVGQRMFDRGAFRGYEKYKVFCYQGIGPSTIFSDYPIKVPSDLLGKKVRAPFRPQAEMLKGLGVATIDIGAPQIVESMSRGVIDAAFADIVMGKLFRVNDVAHHHLMLPFGTTSAIWLMKKDKYDSLPEKAKKALDIMSPQEISKWKYKVENLENEVVSELKKDPTHTLYYPTEDETRQWKEAFKPGIDFLKNELGEENFSRLLKIMREEIANYRQEYNKAP